MLNFYDFEVFQEDWLAVFVNPIEHTECVIVNDGEKLKSLYEAHKNEVFVGYNSRNYDVYIFKSILCGMVPYYVSKWIIDDGLPGWQYSDEFRHIRLINFDVMMGYDSGLKSLEAFMGHDIHETSVPFDIKRKLTVAEIKKEIKYCHNDVVETIEVFMRRKSEFDAALGIINTFRLPLDFLGKTNAQRVAHILGGRGLQFDDEFDFPIADTLRLHKYAEYAEWYRRRENHNYDRQQVVQIAGVEHTLAWGGLHGAIPQYHGHGIYLMADVTAYYPSLQLRYKFGYRNMANPQNFEKIHKENLRLKQLGDKAARLPYKIADNCISGQLKDEHSPLYDPRENNAVCVNGQLLLVDLIEHLEPHIEQLIQSNTDGTLVKLSCADDYDVIDDVVWEWEQRTGMRMEFEVYTDVFQKDVNNYLLIGADGHVKTKGAYTKALSDIDNDLPIVNKATVEYMLHGTEPEQTIGACDELQMFQKVVKLSSKYWAVWHNGTYTRDKCHRVFASTDSRDTYIGKTKKQGGTIEKFANTPKRCFIENGNVIGRRCPPNLDKQWYVDLTKERLKQYGVSI